MDKLFTRTSSLWINNSNYIVCCSTVLDKTKRKSHQNKAFKLEHSLCTRNCFHFFWLNNSFAIVSYIQNNLME